MLIFRDNEFPPGSDYICTYSSQFFYDLFTARICSQTVNHTRRQASRRMNDPVRRKGTFMKLSVRARHSFCLLIGVFVASLSHAAVVTDPPDDFLGTFTGPQNGDLDVLTAQVTFNGTSFLFDSTENGAIGTTAQALYVWGIDRGTHTEGFGAFRPGVLFDAVVILRPDLTGTVIDTTTGTPTNLAPGSVTINGDTIQGIVPATLLPSLGIPQSDFGFNLWPRTGLGNNALIADFAPDNSDASVTVVPEPSLTFGVLGALLLGTCLKVRRSALQEKIGKLWSRAA